MAEKKIVFTPMGTMNQDSSVLTPGQDTAGRSPFMLGDYRYALNARIGSSRSDNFGDLENLRATAEIEDYYVKEQVLENPEFEGSISGWTNLGDGTAWDYSIIPAARCVFGSGTGARETSTLYQAVPGILPGLMGNFSFDIRRLGILSNVNDFVFKVVFLNGTSIIDSVDFYTNSKFSAIRGDFDLLIPTGTTGIGFKITFTKNIANASDLLIPYFRAKLWVEGEAPAGMEKTIGELEDPETLNVYYTNWNSNGDHTLRFYNHSENRIYELLKWSGLNFQQDYFVKLAKIDNWLAFTDRNNSPRLVDVTKINDLFLALGDADFREYHISFHKWAPVLPPVPRSVYVTNQRNESLYRKNFQFAYRYIYYGGLYSRLSPIAVCHGGVYDDRSTGSTITHIDLEMPGMILDDPGANVEFNYFDHTSNKFKQSVEFIEVMYREGVRDIWRVFDRRETADITSLSNSNFQFRNDGYISIVAENDTTYIYDSVPIKAGSVENIDNRFVFGDCLNDYVNPPSFEVEDVSIFKVQSGADWLDTVTSGSGQFTSLSPTDRDKLFNFTRLHRFSFKERTKICFGIQWIYSNGRRSLVKTNDLLLIDIPDNESFEMSYNTGINFKISDDSAIPEDAVAYSIVRTESIGVDYFIFGVVNEFSPLIDSLTAIISDDKKVTGGAIKNRITQSFENSRIIAADDYIEQRRTIGTNSSAGRYDVTFGNSGLGSYDKKYTQNINSDNGLSGAERQGIREAAFDAGYDKKTVDEIAKNSQLALQILSELRATEELAFVDKASRVYININNWYNASLGFTPATNNPMNEVFYNFREGDRVRFVGADVTNPTNEQKKIYDLKIIEWTGYGLIVSRPSDLKWIPPDIPAEAVPGEYSPDDYVIEVYTPEISPSAKNIYFDTSEIYPVLYPGTANRAFSKKDWVYVNNASVTATTLPNGFKIYHKMPYYSSDMYRISKTFYWEYPGFSERGAASTTLSLNSMNIDKMKIYDFWDKSNGRASIASIYQNEPKFFPTQLRFSGRSIELSNASNINKVNEPDQFIYPSEYGRIRDIVNTSNAQVESVGSILLVIGERETWSVYVNRTTLEDLSGRTQVQLANRVLGSYNTLLGSYGTLNPESVCKENGRVYYFDAIKGAWIRYSRDGLTEISRYKMRNWFRELASLLIGKYQTSEVPVAISEFDCFNEELVTFNDHSTLPESFRGYNNYKGAFFSEDKRGWTSIHNYTPERFAKIALTLLSFRGGKLYKHEQDGVNSNTFYGEKFDTYIEPVANDNPFDMKSWQNIAIVSTHGWSVERFMSEYRGDKDLQESRILLTSFENKEDAYYAAIKNDLNTPNVPNPIIKGNKMRSKALRALLKLDPEVVTLSLLHYVTFGYIDSPKNP